MDQYINLKGFENSANGAQLKYSKYHIVELNITFYKTPIIFIEYVLEDPVSVHENTHIFTDMDEFVLFLKKYTYDGTAIMFENPHDMLDYYENINMYFNKHNINICDYEFYNY